MKSINSLISSSFVHRPIKLLLGIILLSLGVGCASEKDRPVFQRGWIGGEYVLAQSPEKTQKHALRIVALSTNTPAWNAGLRPDDVILELNQQPLVKLKDLQSCVDKSQPGTPLAIKAAHAGRVADYTVQMGRETFRRGGNFSVVLPTVIQPWDLWPDPGFSLVLLGYEPNASLRPDLGKRHELYDERWKAFLVFFEVSSGDRVLTQEK